MATRCDIVAFKAKRTDEGFIRDTPVVGRVGIQLYRNADGSIRRELRLPEEVFATDSLASFAGKPVTDDHPAEAVTSANYKRLTVGSILSQGQQDGEFVRADIVINDGDAVDKAVKGGKRALSLGYSLDLDETPGEWNGERYDAIQRNIRINHLAIVKAGRAGEAARLNMDAVQITADSEDKHMPNMVRLDNGLDYEAAPEVAQELAKYRKDASDLAAKLTKADADMTSVKDERDKLQARVDGFDAELKKAREEGVALATVRADAIDVARAYKVDVKDDMSLADIRKAVVLAHRKDVNLDGKSDAYIEAAFDLAKESRADVAMQDQRKDASGIPTADKKDNRLDADEARDRMLKHLTGEGE